MTKARYVPPRPPWMDEAGCAGIGSDWWYPPARRDGSDDSGREAKRVCRSCPVRVECLEYALAINEEFGIWGGLTPGERRKIPQDTPLTADLLDRLG